MTLKLKYAGFDKATCDKIVLQNADSKELLTVICIAFVQVLTMETFEHLGFLVQFSEGTSLSQAATFFANSDPDMPAAPVPAAQVLDWMSQNIASSLEYSAERSAAKESNQQTMSDLDVTMAEANTSQPRNSTPSANPAYYRNVTFVEGFSKTSVVKHASDIKGNSVKVH